MILEIWVSGKKLDLFVESNIRQTLQLNDIAELKDRQASYTNSFNIPKTANNKRIFDGLGTASDTSRVPYQKPNCLVKLEGFDFLTSGWLNITETSDNYKVYIYSGIINFFKAIENKTLGDLDLAEIEHVKNVDTVVASVSNPDYKYLITDYNGLTHYGTNNETINIDYLVPSVSVKYLWNKIHSTFLYTYEGDIFSEEDFTNLWLTYPKFLEVGQVEEPILTATSQRSIRLLSHYEGGARSAFDQLPSADFTENVYFEAIDSAKYKITLKINNTFSSGPPALLSNYYYSVNQETLPLNNRPDKILIYSEPLTEGEKETPFYVDLNAGDKISFFTECASNDNVYWNSEYEMKFEQVIPSTTSFSNELKDFSITDFMKEILNQLSLTVFPSEFEPKNLKYLTFKKRIETATRLDWTNKYLERTSEKYVLDSYAQKNFFTYQYNDKEESYHNGSININNVNLNEKTTSFSSKTYSPEKNLTSFYTGSAGNRFLRVFKIYDKNVKDENGVTKIEYKGLDKRFHFVRAEYVDTTVQIGSQTLQEQQSVSSIYVASFSKLDWPTLLNKNYRELGQVINDSRVHNISLNLGLMDFIDFDFNSLIYFAQEQQYYFPNKLEIDYKSGKASGEFIRVKMEIDGADIINPTEPGDTQVKITWGDNTILIKTIGHSSSAPMPTEVIKIAQLIYPADDELVGFDWEVFDGTSWTSLGTGVTPYTVTLFVGMQRFRMKATSINGNVFYSNELQITVLGYACTAYHAYAMGNSGDDLIANFLDCEGNPQELIVSAPGGTLGYFLELNFCAASGSVSINRGTLEEQGEC